MIHFRRLTGKLHRETQSFQKVTCVLFTVLTLIGLVPRPTSGQVAQAPEWGEKGMVVTAREEASHAGREVLRDGGNAVDAAVTVGFVLAVTYPRAGNIGGGGFMVFRDKNGQATTIDFREEAPAAATRDMYQDEDGNVVPRRSRYGHLASGIPGSVAGMLTALEKYGTMSRNRVMTPAIQLARDGFTLTRSQAERFNQHYTEFSNYPGSGKYFTKGDSAKKFRAGEQFVQRDLAEVLERIRDQGRDGFYAGRTAELIVEEMERGGGLITKSDLANYEAKEREPVVGTYRDYRIMSMPSPSSGGIAIVQLLNAVEPYDLTEMGFHSSESIHLMGEAMRRVYADRAKWLGDSDFFPVPREGLIGKEYMRERMASFNPYRADTSETISHGFPPGHESAQTTHYSVVDSAGNAVAVTTTINAGFGSKVVVDGAGFFLNNEMDDFSAKPGVPNMYGLIGGEANAIEPGKRMLSSMSPTIVEDPDGRLYMVVGTPGGSTIITTVFQVITNVIDFGMDIQEAVSAGRIHHQWLPDVMEYETGTLAPDVVRNLERRGWTVESDSPWGRADAIRVRYQAPAAIPVGEVAVQESTAVRYGGADPRGGDKAAGY